MRTPWRMLADLVSGKPSKNGAETTAQENIADTSEATKLDDGQADTAAGTKSQAKDEVVDVIAREPVVSEEQKEPLAEPVADETVTNNEPAKPAQEAVVSAEPEPAGIVLPKPKTRPAKPAAKHLPVATPAPAKQEKPVVNQANKTPQKLVSADPAIDVPVAKSAFEEMAALDHEIVDLRRRLSEKLALQNAQLRKLIDRYDGR